jgi:hypothetical protein
LLADLLALLGLLLNFAGTLLLVIHRMPALDVTADGRDIPGAEPADAAARSRNLKRYWRHASATRIGLCCLCAGFALQLAGFVLGYAASYPDMGGPSIGTRLPVRHAL